MSATKARKAAKPVAIPQTGAFKRYDRETGDWALYFDGEYIGSAESVMDAEQQLMEAQARETKHLEASIWLAQRMGKADFVATVEVA